MSARTSRSLAFAVYRPFLFFRKAEAALLITVRGDTLASRAAFRKETPSFRIRAIAFVTPAEVTRVAFLVVRLLVLCRICCLRFVVLPAFLGRTFEFRSP